MPILDKGFAQYAKKDSWSLSALTHGEYSWKKARVGLAAGENGNVSMRMENIKKDAERVKLRRFLLSKMNAEDRGTAIPIYDDTCKFMYQKVSNLKLKQSQFYDNFNREENAV